MKKSIVFIVFVSLLSFSTTVAVKADFWSESRDTSKVYVNKAMFWKSEHLEDIGFEHVYPKAFYQTSYFGWTITGAAIVGAGAFSYFSLGSGAPVAATGVGTVAAWAGGGSGYMAGLSTIGSWFGGNAILGAAILNGLSIGAIGGGLGAKVATMGILAKVGMGLSVTALGLDGIAYFKNPETDQLEYRVRVAIPKDLGSKEVRRLVDKIYEKREEEQEANEEKNSIKRKKILEEVSRYNNIGLNKLRKKLMNEDYNPEDLLVLGVIAANLSKDNLFHIALSKINRSELDDMGFIYYLDAIDGLYHDEDEKTILLNLKNASDENKYALEPIALQINILGYDNFSQNESNIESLVRFAEDNFDSDEYMTPLSLVSIYYRVGTFYFINERYAKAQDYYEKAKDDMGLIEKHFYGKELKHTIELSISNSMYKQGKVVTALKMYNEIIEDIDKEDIEEIKKIKEEYLGNHS